jgi:hypothetical protein
MDPPFGNVARKTRKPVDTNQHSVQSRSGYSFFRFSVLRTDFGFFCSMLDYAAGVICEAKESLSFKLAAMDIVCFDRSGGQRLSDDFMTTL